MLQNSEEKGLFQSALSNFFSPERLTPVSNTLYSFEDVSVNFGTCQALKSVQLKIEKGEIVFVTGVSGAGKTTLLKIMAGEDISYSGKVERPLAFGRRGGVFVARVFQELRLISGDTCEENLFKAYDSSIYGPKKEFIQDMMELARILGIKDRLHLEIKSANGGLKQKVAIARALLGRPDVFIADEPTSSLDFDNAKKVFEVLNLYNSKRGMTVVWASHNSELIKKFTGRILHLDNGRLVYSGHACFI